MLMLAEPHAQVEVQDTNIAALQQDERNEAGAVAHVRNALLWSWRAWQPGQLASGAAQHRWVHQVRL